MLKWKKNLTRGWPQQSRWQPRWAEGRRRRRRRGWWTRARRRRWTRCRSEPREWSNNCWPRRTSLSIHHFFPANTFLSSLPFDAENRLSQEKKEALWETSIYIHENLQIFLVDFLNVTIQALFESVTDLCSIQNPTFFPAINNPTEMERNSWGPSCHFFPFWENMCFMWHFSRFPLQKYCEGARNCCFFPWF